MPVQFFKVPLSVQPKGGGEAEFVPPKVLQELSYRFLIVKDGAAEAIIEIEESEAVLETIEKAQDCQKLSEAQMKELKDTYPKPKLKQKYRLRVQTQEGEEAEAPAEAYEVDEQGNKIVDTFQTVRAGFYLIDLPVSI